jgi:hypothetical protein
MPRRRSSLTGLLDSLDFCFWTLDRRATLRRPNSLHTNTTQHNTRRNPSHIHIHIATPAGRPLSGCSRPFASMFLAWTQQSPESVILCGRTTRAGWGCEALPSPAAAGRVLLLSLCLSCQQQPSNNIKSTVTLLRACWPNQSISPPNQDHHRNRNRNLNLNRPLPSIRPSIVSSACPVSFLVPASLHLHSPLVIRPPTLPPHTTRTSPALDWA